MGNNRIYRASSDTRLPVGRVTAAVLAAVASFVIGTVAAVQAADEVYEYDALGRLIKVELPDGTKVEYDLDAVGNRVEKKVSSNSPPVAVNDWAFIDVAGLSVVVNAVANDTDPDQDTLEIISITQPSPAHAGTATLLNTTQIRITGWDSGSLTYTVSDGNGGTDVGTVTFEVIGGW